MTKENAMDIVTGGLPDKGITLTFLRQEVIGGAKKKGGKKREAAKWLKPLAC